CHPAVRYHLQTFANRAPASDLAVVLRRVSICRQTEGCFVGDGPRYVRRSPWRRYRYDAYLRERHTKSRPARTGMAYDRTFDRRVQHGSHSGPSRAVEKSWTDSAVRCCRFRNGYGGFRHFSKFLAFDGNAFGSWLVR